MSFISVVLPQPDGPTTAMVSPAATVKLQSSMTCGSESLKRYCRPRTSSPSDAPPGNGSLSRTIAASGSVSTMSARRSACTRRVRNDIQVSISRLMPPVNMSLYDRYATSMPALMWPWITSAAASATTATRSMPNSIWLTKPKRSVKRCMSRPTFAVSAINVSKVARRIDSAPLSFSAWMPRMDSSRWVFCFAPAASCCSDRRRMVGNVAQRIARYRLTAMTLTSSSFQL